MKAKKTIYYEGFGIGYNIHGKNEYSVQWTDGDEHIFWSLNDAKRFIEESLEWEKKLMEEAEKYFL